MIGWKDWVFAPVKQLVGKIISEMINSALRTLKPTQSVGCVFVLCSFTITVEAEAGMTIHGQR